MIGLPVVDCVASKWWERSSEWLIDDLGVDPLHQAAELLSNLLDLVFALNATLSLECRGVGSVFQDPLAGELSGLDFGKDLLHLLLGLRGDDA